MPSPIPPSQLSANPWPPSLSVGLCQPTLGHHRPTFACVPRPLVLCLRQGKDGMRKILFVRVNDNLYIYSNERFGAALANIQQGTPPPLPIK
ncbi:hypothetical protein PISMIDRAFT_18982 [Pisolithus microcarpus 441]|uniref:Uncharacterized protein n=1 Tax=Pisolithus microcarpus 441 TaxID=765257 RepID=A0A0C9XIE9_9AGAM|nr:hypothetical protein PISMIDRAFT_18982 [Pisolithus microcarpus 441]